MLDHLHPRIHMIYPGVVNWGCLQIHATSSTAPPSPPPIPNQLGASSQKNESRYFSMSLGIVDNLDPQHLKIAKKQVLKLSYVKQNAEVVIGWVGISVLEVETVALNR